MTTPARKPPKPETTIQPSSSEVLFGYLLRFQRFGTDLLGILFVSVALISLLGLAKWTEGALITPWTDFILKWLGLGSYLVALFLGIVGLILVVQSHIGVKNNTPFPRLRWSRVLAIEVFIFALMALMTVLGGIEGDSLDRAEAGLDGGLIGWGLAELLRYAVGDFMRTVVLVFFLMLSGIAGFGLFPHLKRWAWSTSAVGVGSNQAVAATEPEKHQVVEVGDRYPGQWANRKPQKKLEPQFQKNFKVSDPLPKNGGTIMRDDTLPPLTLLINEKPTRPDERHINLTAGLIEKTLAEFGIPAKVIGFQVGPTVTQFAVQPGFIEKAGGNDEEEIRKQKVRVAQIAGLSRDLSLALSAERLRIEAPVPGRNYIGIEVPNRDLAIVRLRPILESDAFYMVGSPLAVPLGLDVSGYPVIADLAKMPHLLIAGTTGSGKSVCISAIAASLVMNNTPDQLKLVLIDPKKVELIRFNGLPHILGQVETDLERILGVLRWVVAEMDRRYRLLEQYRSRNIQSFNSKMEKRKNPPEEPLPYMVVLVDELADLMMVSAEQTEPALVRLAQMARATGIHMVLATQRPSTDVVTGLIKANFPARLAFNVASSIDSRVILDTQGAETLLGKGDMLFLPPEAGSPIRAQGVFLSDHELNNVVRFWQGKYGQSPETAPWEQMLEEEAVLADRDDLVRRAIEIVKKTRRASASMLQRRLHVGYPRAARLIDQLEDLGVIGPSQGGGREREVLMDEDDDYADIEFADDE